MAGGSVGRRMESDSHCRDIRRKILIIDAHGNTKSELALSDGQRIGGLTFTPDGARLLVGACGEIERDLPDDSCTQRLLLAPPDDADIDPDEPREIALPGPGPDAGSFFRPDFQPADHPVILVPGFMGTEMACPQGKLWPSLGDANLLNLQLNDAGTGNARGTCGAAPTRLLESVAFFDVYGPLKRELEKLLTDPNDPRTQNRVHPFVWDWRLEPRPQLAKLNARITEALSDELSQKQALDEVILVAHSAGGLVARAALNDAALLKRIRRVLTIGTPYLGAPKSFFPLLAGVSEPGTLIAGLLNPVVVQKLSRNLTGNFILFPSAQYGSWLRKDGANRDLGQAGTLDYLRHGLHASRQALALAFAFKSTISSGFKRLEPAGLREFRVLAGTGLPTIDHINLLDGGARAGIGYVTGDQTVPVQSATQTPAGARSPLGDPVRISYLCNLEHLRSTQDPKLFELMGDFIRYGSPPRKTQACGFTGFEYSVREVGGTKAGGSRVRGPRTPVGTRALRTLAKAERAGVLEVMALPGEPKIVTGRGFEGSTAFRVRGC